MSGSSRPTMRKQAYGNYDRRPATSHTSRDAMPRNVNTNASTNPALFPPRFMYKTPTSRPAWDLGDISIPIRKRRRDDGGEGSSPTLMHPSMTIRSRRTPMSMPPASRAARKLDVPLVTKGARKFEYENVTALHQIGRKSTSGKAARKIEPPSRMHAEVLELPDSSEDEDDGVSELKAALKALTLSGIRLKEYKRLPFLCRNVRRGFKIRCRKASVRTQPKEEPPARVKVLYRYSFDGENGSDASSSSSDLEMYEDKMGGMSRWLCPLCQVYGVFDTREMLDFHLSRDHDTVKVSWTQPIVDDKPTWQITLVIPDPDSDSSDTESESEEDESENEDVNEGTVTTKTEERFDEAQLLSEPPPSSTEPSFTPESTDSKSPHTPRSMILPLGPMDVFPPSPVKIQHKFRLQSPSPATPTVTASRTLSTTTWTDRSTTISTRGSLPARYPTPPPPSDPLGPAAQPPYLPELSADGRPLYSCRIGKPRIYDVLNMLPLEKFGILAWVIVDREEELFEMDDILDEDKVILALWNRWIMLNRTTFVFNEYVKGVINFVDEYWRTIHLGAGWGALRAFLLMLLAIRYLNHGEVARILKHYETYTGMDYWYKEDLDEIAEDV